MKSLNMYSQFVNIQPVCQLPSRVEETNVRVDTRAVTFPLPDSDSELRYFFDITSSYIHKGNIIRDTFWRLV